MNSQADKREIFVKNVRCAFVNLFRTTQFEGQGEYYYGMVLLVEPGSENDRRIKQAIQAAAEQKWEKKAQAVLTTITGQSQKFCYIDGNMKEYDGFQGKMALSTKRRATDGAPKILDRDLTELPEMAGKPYAGCYVTAKVQLWAQDNQFGKGIRCTLIAVQFVQDGDAFGGTAPANADGFESIETPATESANDFM